MWLGVYVSRWPQSMQSPCCAARATRGYKGRITHEDRTAHQSDGQTRRCHWLRGSTRLIRLHTKPITRSAATSRHVGARTTRGCHAMHTENLDLRYRWLRGSVVTAGGSRRPGWAKALAKPPAREYIKVIFVGSQELVYRRGVCFILAEVCARAGVRAVARACLCLCSRGPLALNNRAKWVSIPFQQLKCSHGRSLAGPRRLLLTSPNKRAELCFRCVLQVCAWGAGRGGLRREGAVDILAVQHSCEGKNILACAGSLSNSRGREL